MSFISLTVLFFFKGTSGANYVTEDKYIQNRYIIQNHKIFGLLWNEKTIGYFSWIVFWFYFNYSRCGVFSEGFIVLVYFFK